MIRSILKRAFLMMVFSFGAVLQTLATTDSIEQALLAENWRALMNTLGEEACDQAAWSAILRGHATLATNSNDNSVHCFLAASTPHAIGEWDAWTAQHLERHPQSSIAWYLRGDAFARREAWNDALNAFTQAIKLNENNGLAWNARGVVHALKARWNNAGDDFAAAIARQPDLADAYANTGVVYILQSIGRKETLNRTFDAALKRSPHFTLAKVGAAAMQFGIGEWDAAATALEVQAAAKDPVGSLAAMNLAVVRFGQREAMRQASEGDLLAGTTVTVQSGTRTPSRGDTLSQEILTNELGAIANGGFAKWGKDSAAVLSAISEASGLGLKPASVMNPVGRIAKAFEIGISLGTSGSADAASRMQAKANRGEHDLREHDMTRTMNNLRTHPNSEGFRNAAVNWLTSAHSAQARDVAQRAGFKQPELDALLSSQPKAGGAILSFQRTYTSRGGWGMYVPFGLVYTGFDPSDGATATGSGDEASSTKPL